MVKQIKRGISLTFLALLMLIGSVFAVPVITIETTNNNVVSEAQVNLLELNGTVEEGDEYSISINGNAETYTVLGTESNMSEVTYELHALLVANVDIVADVDLILNESYITVTSKIAGTPVIIIETATNIVRDLTNTLTTETNTDNIEYISPVAQSDLFTVSGLIEVVDEYEINIIEGVNDDTITYLVDGTEANLSVLVANFVTQFNLEVVANVEAVQVGDTNFTITTTDITKEFVSITNTINDGVDSNTLVGETITLRVLEVIAESQIDTITIGGTVEVGDYFEITVNENSINHTLTGIETLDDVLVSLESKLNANVNISANVTALKTSGTTITITADVAGITFTSSTQTSSATTTDDNTLDNTLTNTNVESESQVDVISFENANEEGYVFEVSVDGVLKTKAYTNTNIADNKVSDLNTKINSIVGVSSEVVDSTIVITADVAGTEMNNSVRTYLVEELLSNNVIYSGDTFVGGELLCNYSFNGSEISTSTYTVLTGDRGNTIICEVTTNIDNVVEDLVIESNGLFIASNEISISNGAIFSIPTCVDSEQMISEASITENDIFVSYTTGQWSSYLGNFEVLKGYKYLGDREFTMPVYYSDVCDLSEIKIQVNNDWNLFGVNSQTITSMSNLMWSLTLSSSTNMFVNGIYDVAGDLVCTYDLDLQNFGDTDVTPFEAYWSFYAGDDSTMFSGAIEELN